MTTGELIRQLRKARGWTQEELAHRCGYSGKSVICKVEAAERPGNTEKIKKIADALGVSPASLVDWESMESLPDDSDTKIIHDFVMTADENSIHQLRLYAEFLKNRGEQV